MKINEFFAKRLKAPLHNPIWSWGSVDTKSRNVFFRAGSWALQEYDDGKEWVILYEPKWDHESSPGAPERSRHIELLRNGFTGYAVIIEFKDDGKISSFESEKLLLLGQLVADTGTVFAEVKDRILIDDVIDRPRKNQSRVRDILEIVGKKRYETEREAWISARIGQGEFRESVLRLWNYKCALTGSTLVSAIRASHIKPWMTSTSTERLDPFNGIPLLATFDVLFDRGFISFDRSGELLVSSRLVRTERKLLGLEGLNGVGRFPQRSLGYIKYHRDEVFH